MTELQFNRCVDELADRLYRFILRNLRHEEDARDIVQSSFERLWQHRGKVRAETVKSYLFTIAYRQMLDHLRRSKRVELKEALPEDSRRTEPVATDLKRILATALDRLSEQQRSLVLLRDYEGYSYAEIGEITGLGASQVKVYLHRARMQLRQYIVDPENVC